MEVNFGNVAKNYVQYRNDLPVELLESLKLRGIDFNNKKVVDLGSGTGVLSRVLHNEGAAVVGVEPSAELIEQAKVIDKSEG
ncbi:class I SAM-dependent methyltransferase, partial [Peribacillus frigoritolerans]|uniref:class I SAM-dependent methyltransferase n=2 Tax=Peribacillus TaxID=2675229 RepID=UPI003394AAB0